GSELQKMQLGRIEGVIRNFDLSIEKRNQELVLTAIQNGLIESAHDCSEGGLAIALAESAFKHQLGISVQFELSSAQLFAETQSRFVLTVAPENKTRFEEMMGDAAVLAGKVTDEAIIEISATDGQIKIETAVARKCWEDAIVCLMK
ncbi:TPA: phosphoribosylformylglycinamidine synthase II, partial [Enterococcus faecium]|nr:phosphoribosylformylglycinamidine synthase II [Enterococcus faecium]